MLMQSLKPFWRRLGFTWILLIIENALWVSVPFFVGRAIDGLRNGDHVDFYILCAVFVSSLTIMVGRRFYDTRTYESIYERLCNNLTTHNAKQNIAPSTTNARIGFCREIVDFLEEDLVMMVEGIIKLIVALVLLGYFGFWYLAGLLVASAVMVLVFGLSSGTYTRFNALINDLTEKQVHFISTNILSLIKRYFHLVKYRKIALSDLEAINFGLVLFFACVAFLVNLYLATAHFGQSAGEIFSITTYTMEYIEAVVILPMVLQNFFRIREIMGRLGGDA